MRARRSGHDGTSFCCGCAGTACNDRIVASVNDAIRRSSNFAKAERTSETDRGTDSPTPVRCYPAYSVWVIVMILLPSGGQEGRTANAPETGTTCTGARELSTVRRGRPRFRPLPPTGVSRSLFLAQSLSLHRRFARSLARLPPLRPHARGRRYFIGKRYCYYAFWYYMN